MQDSFIEKIRDTIEKHNMLKRHDRVLVGLSGGPDSVVLTYTLSIFRKEYLLDIYIAHLDHKFRGEESRKDREFCEGLAKELSLEIFCEEIDVPRFSREEGLSSEEAARKVRYDFFKRVANRKKIKKIAVGHTKDDQVETVLMRAIRGAGMVGLGGMKPVNNIEGLTVIRPLVELSREDIQEFINRNTLEFRHDSSNDEFTFTRNRIRHELIPYLEKNFNPNIKEVLVNMAENLRMENEFLEKFAKRKFRGVSKKNKSDDIVIDIKSFKKQPEAIRKRILRSALEDKKGNLRRFTYKHWKEMEDLINNRPGNSMVDLPGGINVIKNRDKLVISK